MSLRCLRSHQANSNEFGRQVSLDHFDLFGLKNLSGHRQRPPEQGPDEGKGHVSKKGPRTDELYFFRWRFSQASPLSKAQQVAKPVLLVSHVFT